MRIGIVTDSSCDLPRSFLDQNQIVIMPIAVQGPQGEFIDRRDTDKTLSFYQDISRNGDVHYTTRPFSDDEIRELFLGRLVLEFDYVFCITTMRARSKIFENANHASLSILSEYRPIREAASIKTPFSLRVFDSHQLFTGQGLVVAEVLRLIEEGRSSLEIIRHLEQLTQHTQAFLVPENLSQLRNNARQRGDKSVSFMAYTIGSALDIKPVIRAYRGDTNPFGKVRGFSAGCDKLFAQATEQITQGRLLAPTICVSYGGNTETVEQMPGYQKLLAVAAAHQVQVLLSEMGTAAVVNTGLGGISVAWASEYVASFD